MKLNDDSLTSDGLEPEGKGRILVLACGALAREILALVRINGWRHVTLSCLPAILHNSPERIPAAVEEAVMKHAQSYETIFLAYADCGTGGRLKALAERLGTSMIEGPHCYSFFEGNAAFAARGETEIDVFYLTDFLTRQFEAFVIKPLGLDRHPGLRDAYFGNYRKLVYLAQTEDADLDAKARVAAGRLGLAYERRFTGYGDLEAALAKGAATGDQPRQGKS
jgi:hypothetical protein